MTPVFGFSFSRTRAHCGRQGSWQDVTLPISTVPLLCSQGGFEIEDVDEVKGSFAQVEALEQCPQVDDVALDAAGRIEAIEGVLVELDSEGAALGLAVLVVDGTGATTLATAAFEVGRQAKVLEHALEGELALDMGEVHPHSAGAAGRAAAVL